MSHIESFDLLVEQTSNALLKLQQVEANYQILLKEYELLTQENSSCKKRIDSLTRTIHDNDNQLQLLQKSKADIIYEVGENSLLKCELVDIKYELEALKAKNKHLEVQLRLQKKESDRLSRSNQILMRQA